MSTDDTGVQQQQQQRIIIKLLVAEGVVGAEIHRRLAAVFRDDCHVHVYVKAALVFATTVSWWMTMFALVRRMRQ